tara:strand:- start:1090 stop:1476 length:387 start_codon:yes stop_codon:yes gene_type:complete
MNYIPTDEKSQENYHKYKDNIFKELTMNNIVVTRMMILDKMHNKNLINLTFYKRRRKLAKRKDKIDEYNSMKISFTLSSVILTIFGIFIYPILLNNLLVRVIYILYLSLLYIVTIVIFYIRYSKDHED